METCQWKRGEKEKYSVILYMLEATRQGKSKFGVLQPGTVFEDHRKCLSAKQMLCLGVVCKPCLKGYI